MTEPIFTNEVQARYADPADLARRTISRIDAVKNAEQRAREAANAAEAALGSHQRDYDRGNKVWNETWARVYDEQMEAWRHSLHEAVQA